MGSITFTVVGGAAIGTRTKTFAVPDADVARFAAMCREWYGQANTAPALLAWANDMMAISKERVVQTEKAVAARAAEQPFTAT